APGCCPTAGPCCRPTIPSTSRPCPVRSRRRSRAPRTRRSTRTDPSTREEAHMKVAIAGAGAVGRSIARELLRNAHEVMLIERKLDHVEPESVPDATWVHADACELSSLES